MADIGALESRANEMRKDIVRILCEAGSGHPGGSLSCIDMLTALYFGDVLKYDPADPKLEERDRFILAKGHAAPALYTTLAHAGYFPESELIGIRKLGSMLQGHPDSTLVPGVEVSTGSLGQGLSIAAGLACGLRIDNEQPPCVFAILGDGECEEGQVWEAAMFASHQQTANLIAIVDYNGLQIDGNIEDVAGLNQIADKFKAFGWDVEEIDGHDIAGLIDSFTSAKQRSNQMNGVGAPKAFIAKTVKGKGVSFMEGQAGWHGVAPNQEQAATALEELSCVKGDI